MVTVLHFCINFFHMGIMQVTNMKVMFVLFARWKGAKITTEHAMHVLRAYRVSLASLRPSQVSCLTSGNCFGM